MQFTISNKHIEIRAYHELLNEFVKLNIDFTGMTYTEVLNVMMTYYTGTNKELCQLLLSDFNIATSGDFANRAAKKLCSNCKPHALYVNGQTPTFSEYILSILKMTTRYILHVYLQAHPIINTGWANIDTLSINQNKIVNDILLKIDIPRTHNILRFAKQPFYSGNITKQNISTFLQLHNIINAQNESFTDILIDELDLDNLNFNRQMVESMCPSTNIEWLLLQKHYIFKGIQL